MTFTAVTPGLPAHLTPVTTVTASLTVADLTNGNSVTVVDPTRTVIVLTNAAALAGSVKVSYVITPDGQTITPPAITIPLSSTVVLSNWPPQYFGNSLQLTYTGAMTGLTIQVYSI